MAHKYDHLREKAVALRTEKRMTLDDIVECLTLPKATVYEWIKDIPIPFTEKQSEAQRRRADANRVKYALLREKAYQQGLEEAPELLKDLSFRDFVVLYMAEGSKRDRNRVEFVNSYPTMIRLANRWISQLTKANKIDYRIQCHVDHDENELKTYWANIVGALSEKLKIMRKSNSNQLSGRQFRSQYGLLSISVNDTVLRSRLQAWMDYLKAQW